MDVTVRASQQARQSHVQETQNEGEALIEFGAFFSQFNSASRGLKSVGDLAMPNTELTQGMTSNEGMDDHRSSQSLIESDKGREDLSEQVESSDDVTAARKLLSEQRHKDHQMDNKHARVAKSKRDDRQSAVDQQDEAALTKEGGSDVLSEQMYQSDVDASPAQLSSDAYGNAQTTQSIKQIQSTEAKSDAVLDGNRKGKNSGHAQGIRVQSSADSQADIEQMSDVETGLIEQSKLKRNDSSTTIASQRQHESLKIESQQEAKIRVEEVSMEGMSEVDAGALETSSKPTERNHVGAQQSSDQFTELSSLNAGAKSGLVSAQTQQSGDTVQLSAKGRTIGNLVGSNTRAKFGLSQRVKEPALARPQTPTRAVELPEDVDKLSIISQISDGMKLRFGGDQTLEVNLNPAELGRVRLQLEMQGDKTVNIKVSAEHAVIADLLQMNLNDLRKDLLAQGVQVNNVEVDVDAHGQGAEQQSEQQSDLDEHSQNQNENESNDGTQRHQISIQA
jgi:flagellar hook-length control protein FliK